MEKLTVLLSTYNGSKFIKQQIESIICQKDCGCEISLLVRDDGSSDDTIEIVNSYKDLIDITVFSGKNLKPAKSFWDLVLKSPKSDYYAFCDQDDVWIDEKLHIMVDAIRNINTPVLAYHAMSIVDEGLNEYDEYYRNEIYSKSLVYTVLFGDEIAGCTMVFNNSLMNELKRFTPPHLTMHDGWVHRVCLSVNGEVVAIPEKLIKYRQHRNNTVGMKRRNVFKQLSSFAHSHNYFCNLACDMLEGYSENLKEEDKFFLEKLINYKKPNNCCFLCKTVLKTNARRSEKIKTIIKLVFRKF